HCHHPALHSFPTRRSSDLCRSTNRFRRQFAKAWLNWGISKPSKRSIYNGARLKRQEGSVRSWTKAFPRDKILVQGSTEKEGLDEDRKSTRLNSSHVKISYA